MRDRDRIGVDVDDPGVRGRRLRHVVHVADGRDAGADVEELPHTLNARLAWAALGMSGQASSTWPASSRSTAKLCEPPR